MFCVRIHTDSGVFDSTEFKSKSKALPYAAPLIAELRDRGETILSVETIRL